MKSVKGGSLWYKSTFAWFLNMQETGSLQEYKKQLKVSTQTNLQIDFHVIPQRPGQFSDRTGP